MPMNSPEKNSPEGSNCGDVYDLNLPEITPESAPVEHSRPDSASAYLHASLLLGPMSDEERVARIKDKASMEPFVL